MIQLCNEKNVDQVLSEFKEYAQDIINYIYILSNFID